MLLLSFLCGKAPAKLATVLQSMVEQKWVVKNRKRLKGTSTSTAITRQPFYMFNPPIRYKELYEHTRLLPIRGAINDNNHHIGGVDNYELDSQLDSVGQSHEGPYSTNYWTLQLLMHFTLSEHKRKAQARQWKGQGA
jgi:hypothetical protein